MKTKLDRFTALSFRGGKTLKNRVVVPPMASETADHDGFVTSKTIEHYRRLTRSHAGLVFVEYSHVLLSGRSEENQLGIQTDAHIEGLSMISKLIHDSGALAGIQLTHAGGKTSSDLTGGVLMGPSDIPVPVKDQPMETPSPMGPGQIDEWKEAFVRAAGRAQSAGFDLVELHSAHGYGLNQWLSPITNRRTDSYGGTLEKNARLLLETVELIRRHHPGLLISVRMPGQDFLEGGLTPYDAIWIAKELEKAGVDLIDVSSGIGGWRRPRDRTGEGYLVSEAAGIQSELSVPVIGVGGIQSGGFIDEALRQRRFSLAAVGRAILEGPREWAERQMVS